MIIAPNESNILQQLRTFLLAVLPDGYDVVAGGDNRVPEPSTPNFVVMSPPRYERLETNVDTFEDAVFTGSISGAAMDITAVNPNFSGQIKIGSTIFGVGVAANTKVTALGTGTGGLGTYVVNNSQTVSSETLAAGTQSITQNTKCTVQLDFHADDGTSGDAAQTVSTLFRDAFAVEQFANQSPNYGVVPLLAEDPKYLPFINDSQQLEFRWVLDAQVQANQTAIVPQQFSDSVSVELISVDATYPT